jgi:hypothetical protein
MHFEQLTLTRQLLAEFKMVGHPTKTNEKVMLTIKDETT